MPTDPSPKEGPPHGAALDREGFSARYQESAAVLWTIAAAILGDRHHAEDVLQEACVIALTKLDAFDASTSFSAWMSAIVRNVARNAARKGRRQATTAVPPDLLEELGEPDFGASTPVSFAAFQEKAPIDERGRMLGDSGFFDYALRQALLELRPVARAALLLRTLRGLDYREIAAVLGIPEGTAMSHVHRSRQALRGRLTSERPLERRRSKGGGA